MFERQFKKPNQIICPTCYGPAQIKIKNCKISICECKNHHNIDGLNIKEFKKTQFIDESTIDCGICKRKKTEIINYLLYFCKECNLNLCPLCKAKHPKTHNIFDYDKKDFICSIHKEVFRLYCKTCKENICNLCELDHDDHNLISYSKIIIDNNNSENKLQKFKKSIAKFKNEIEKINTIFNAVINYCENFYKFIDEIINNFDLNIRNYENYTNLREIYNEDVSKQIDNIINDKNYTNKIIQIFKMFNNISDYKLNIGEQSAKNFNGSGVNMKNKNKEKELMEEISKKDSEINRSLSLMPFKLNPGEKLITVIFISEDQKVHYSFICKNTDKFNELESRLYDVYPEYSENDNYFLANGRKIARFKDLDYNRIKNSDIITLCSCF